jgi:hypothetical protein
MSLNARAGRRLAAGIALACSAILLPAAALAAPAASATPGQAAAAAVPRCHSGARSTEVWMGAAPGSGFAGGNEYPLELSNISRHTCTLRGYPRVVAVRNGHRVGLPSSPGSRQPRLVTLRPGATAHAMLTVHIPTACMHPVTAMVYVYPPGQDHANPTLISGSFCRTGPTQLDVDSVSSGIAIP